MPKSERRSITWRTYQVTGKEHVVKEKPTEGLLQMKARHYREREALKEETP